MTSEEYNNQFSDEELNREIWKDIPNYEGYYQISSLGRVRSLNRVVSSYPRRVVKKSRLLHPNENKDGHFRVCLTKNKIRNYFFIHRIVLSVYAENYNNFPVCCHGDGVPSNNRIENLRWGTVKDNSDDSRKHGTLIMGEKCKKSKLKEEDIINIRKMYKTGLYTAVELSKKYNVTSVLIDSIVNNKIWRHLPCLTKEDIERVKNIIEKRRRENAKKGENANTAKLKNIDIIKIRKLHSAEKLSCSKISKLYNMSCSAIKSIISGKSWSCVKEDTYV